MSENEGLPKIVCDALKNAREALGLTQPKVALKAGVSTAFINQIENGKKTPALKTLLEKIGPAYGFTNIFEVIALKDVPEKDLIIINEHTPKEPLKINSDGRLVYLVPSEERLRDEEMFLSYVLLEKGSDSGTTSHPGEEAFCVLEGAVELDVGGKKYMLKPFDVAHYKSNQPHRVRNAGKGPAKVLVMRSPAHRS